MKYGCTLLLYLNVVNVNKNSGNRKSGARAKLVAGLVYKYNRLVFV